MVCGAWLAIDRACTPSCCLTCKDCSNALDFARSASTRLPIPAVSVSASFWLKVAWIENFFAPDDSLASEEFTLVSDFCRVATRVEALAEVEIVAVCVSCLLYTSDAADEEDSVALGG